MRHEKLFNKMTEALYKRDDIKFNLCLAEVDYEAAREAYNAACAEDQRRKKEILETFEEFEHYEELIIYILENREELLNLFYTSAERADFYAREIDRDLAKEKEEKNNDN